MIQLILAQNKAKVKMHPCLTADVVWILSESLQSSLIHAPVLS